MTWIGEDAAYGGPVTVALTQCAELAAAGFDVQLLAARGMHPARRLQREVSYDEAGVRVRLFRRIGIPAVGYPGVVSVAAVRAARQRSKDGVIHLHTGRDLMAVLTILFAVRRSTTIIWQTHGMIIPGGRIKRAFDRSVLVPLVRFRRPIMVAFTGAERTQLGSIGIRPDLIEVMPNAAPQTDTSWTGSQSADVLFLSRLHPRKRVSWFVEAAHRLRDTGLRFVVAGPDDGDLGVVQTAMRLNPSLVYLGSLSHDEAMSAVARSRFVVFPADSEPFGMVTLEAMSIGAPVLIMRSHTLAHQLESAGAAAIAEDNIESLTAQILAMSVDEARLAALSERGRATAAMDFSLSTLRRRLSEIYSTGPRRLALPHDSHEPMQG